MKTVTLYTKPGCHLCEAVEQVIVQVRAEIPFDFAPVNILGDPKLFERFKHEIPVIEVDGREIARYRMTAEVLRGALR